MADLTRTLEIIFGADNQVSPVVNDISGALGALDGAVQGAAAPLADIADKVLQVDAALIALGATLIGVSVNEAAKFQSEFNLISTLFDTTDESLSGFREGIKEYAVDSTQSLETINAALGTAIGQGIDFKDSIELIGVAEKAAVANRADLNSATELLVGTMNAYGTNVGTTAEKVATATNLSDIFFRTIDEGKITLDELNQGFAQLTSLGATLGVPVETLGAALATMTASGVPASEAITKLRSILDSLIAPTEKAKKTSEDLGIEWDAQAVRGKGLETVLADMKMTVGDNEAAMFDLIGRTEGLQAALLLTGNGAEKFNELLIEMQDVAGATDAAFEKMAQNLDLVIQNVLNRLTLIAIEVGEQLLPSFTEVSVSAGKVAKAIEESIDAGRFDPFIQGIKDIFDDLSGILNDIATNFDEALAGVDFSGLLDALEDVGIELGELFEAFFGPIDLTTVSGLETGIQKVVDSFTALAQLSSGIADSFEPFFDVLGEAVTRVSDSDAETQKLIGNILGYSKQLIDFGTEVGAALIFISETGTDVVKLFDTVGASFTLVVDGIQGELQRNLSNLASFAADLAGIFADVTFGDLSTQFSEIEQSLRNVSDAFDVDSKKNIDSAKAAWDSLTGAVKDSEPTFESAKTNLEGAAKAVGDIATNAKDAGPAIRISETAMNAAKDAARAYALESFAVATINENLGFKAAEDQAAAFAAEIDYLKSQSTDYRTSLDDMAQSTVLLDSQIQSAEGSTATWIETLDKDGNRVFTQIGGAFKSAGQDARTMAEDLDQAKKESQDFLLAWSKIQSQERIAIFTLEAEVQIAKLDAFEKSYTAAFAAIESAWQSTADVITSGFDLLGTFKGSINFNDIFDFIQDVTNAELEIRRMLAESQIELNESLAEFFEQRAEAARRGDAQIKIDTTGLTPALELVMFEVAERMRIAVTNDEGNFLLGIS